MLRLISYFAYLASFLKPKQNEYGSLARLLSLRNARIAFSRSLSFMLAIDTLVKLKCTLGALAYR